MGQREWRRKIGAARGVQQTLERIAEAAVSAGRDPSGIQLIAVTKGVDPKRIAQARAAGATRIGESRVQEAEAKRPGIPDGMEWHMVGRLQSNKARKAAQLFDCIQSVDSEKLLRLLNKRCEELNVRRRVLIQVNCTGEASKSGIAPHQLNALLEAADAAERLDAVGLMTIGPLGGSRLETRRAFASLRKLAHNSTRARQLRHLSMGMTGDLEWAVAEGATMVRVGTGIFGAREAER